MATVVERFRAFDGREQLLLFVGAGLLVVHVVNHIIAEETVDVAPTVITSAMVLTALLYAVLPKLVVVLVTLFAGITHTVGGIIHLAELFGGDPHGGDYTGPFSTAGSLLLIALALYIAARWYSGRTATA